MTNKLTESGWFEGRTTDCTVALQRFRAEGHPVADWFSRIASEFDRLTVQFEKGGRPDLIVFDVAETGRKWYPQNVAAHEALLGKRLLPIGYTYQEHLLLLVAETGEWFGGYDGELWRLGADIHETIARLTAGGDFEPVD